METGCYVQAWEHKNVTFYSFYTNFKFIIVRNNEFKIRIIPLVTNKYGNEAGAEIGLYCLSKRYYLILLVLIDALTLPEL